MELGLPAVIVRRVSLKGSESLGSMNVRIRQNEFVGFHCFNPVDSTKEKALLGFRDPCAAFLAHTQSAVYLFFNGRALSAEGGCVK